jgi:Fe-S cluster assembly ATP-binding protein
LIVLLEPSDTLREIRYGLLLWWFSMLQISNLSVSVAEKQILNNLSLGIMPGTIHALMGPNGSGKSTLAAALMGHPAYTVAEGSIQWQGADITHAAPHERAQAGIFLAVQYPPAIPGVRIKQFLLQACRAVHKESFCPKQFEVEFDSACVLLGLAPAVTYRGLNDGFSGGEKKRLELLQMLMLKPSLIILDEIDSGLDIDAIRLVGTVIAQLKKERPEVALLIITHYQRILDYITPDYVHVMQQGQIVQTGGALLVAELEMRGYDTHL